ncbi:hypothetical protein [Arthrobacter sp. GMC3]|uniref:hypothetical protein n=1 Tax=Arthrobacter sp. GMC3 TaxID=2058894 RepID=UPI000CE4CFC4|nr:hypothetical protein [Arthrobacter sp. GMC3]
MRTEAIVTQGEFFAPVGYSVLWPILGAALVVLSLGWVGWIWMSTRPGNHAEVPGFVAPRNPDTVRTKYLTLISAVQHQYDAGRLGGRAAHQELSAAVRSFVYEMTGVRAQRMTLAELRERQLPLLADAVASFYPAEFATHHHAEPQLHVAAELARNVVRSWR